jgi:hypothetical protein
MRYLCLISLPKRKGCHQAPHERRRCGLPLRSRVPGAGARPLPGCRYCRQIAVASCIDWCSTCPCGLPAYLCPLSPAESLSGNCYVTLLYHAPVSRTRTSDERTRNTSTCMTECLLEVHRVAAIEFKASSPVRPTPRSTTHVPCGCQINTLRGLAGRRCRLLLPALL